MLSQTKTLNWEGGDFVMHSFTPEIKLAIQSFMLQTKHSILDMQNFVCNDTFLCGQPINL